MSKKSVYMMDHYAPVQELDQDKRMASLGVVIAILAYKEDQKWLSQSRHLDNQIRQIETVALNYRILLDMCDLSL